MSIAQSFKGFKPLRIFNLFSINRELRRIWDTMEELNGKPFEKAPQKLTAKPAQKKSAKKATKASPVKKDDVKWESNT